MPANAFEGVQSREVWGWRPEATNPCHHVERFKEESRERYLSPSELDRLGHALSEAEKSWGFHPAASAVRLLILSGCRSAEILRLRWDEVNLLYSRACPSPAGARPIPWRA